MTVDEIQFILGGMEFDVWLRTEKGVEWVQRQSK